MAETPNLHGLVEADLRKLGCFPEGEYELRTSQYNQVTFRTETVWVKVNVVQLDETRPNWALIIAPPCMQFAGERMEVSRDLLRRTR